MSVFQPGREQRWEYADETIRAVERWNCAKGCVHGQRDQAAVEEFGPGGSCSVLSRIFLGDPIPEMEDNGRTVTCLKRWPLPEPQGPRPPQEETLFDLGGAA